MIILCILALFGFAFFLGYTASNTYDGDKNKKTRHALQIASYIVYGLVAVFLIFILFMFRRIRLAVAIMKSGALFLKDVWLIILVPILVFIVSVLVFIYWVLALVYIFSSGYIEDKDEDNHMAHITWDNRTKKSFFFEFVAIL